MIIYGKQIFFYVLHKHKKLIKELYLAKELDKKSFALIAKNNLKIKKLDFKTAQALAKGGNHQGFLMQVEEYNFCPLNELKKDDFIIMLYDITDVGNIGAMIRTAYAFGIKSFIIKAQNLACSAVARSSSGALFDVKISLVANVFDVLNELKQLGFYLYASAKDGQNVKEVNFKDKKKLLLMGSEGFGLPSKIIKKCDNTLGIKMKEDFDSLNVSAAFAILCDRIVNG